MAKEWRETRMLGDHIKPSWVVNIHALLKSPLITPNDYTIPEQLHYMLHMLLGISWYVYAMPISHSSPVDIPLTPRLGLLLKVLFISPPSLFFRIKFWIIWYAYEKLGLSENKVPQNSDGLSSFSPSKVAIWAVYPISRRSQAWLWESGSRCPGDSQQGQLYSFGLWYTNLFIYIWVYIYV